MKKTYYLFFFIMVFGSAVYAGNPDRQGEAGAYELLMDPWARTAGLHTMGTSMVRGVESMFLNVAGMARVNKMDIAVGTANYLQGTDIRLNAGGLVRRIGKNGAFGFSLMTVDFGKIPVTTASQPAGTGATFSPNYFNLAFGYSHVFANKVSVGILFRGITEALTNVTASGLAIDAGIQYVTGDQDNFKFGISLRNIGTPMTYRGEALSFQRPSPNGGAYNITVDQRAARFELPSMLNIGTSYDFRFLEKHRLTVLGNFTSNSFSRDQIGGGAEYGFKEQFVLRAGYRYELDVKDQIQSPIYTGLSAGASLVFPLSKLEKETKIGIDYSYRASRVWQGTHNISLHLCF